MRLCLILGKFIDRSGLNSIPFGDWSRSPVSLGEVEGSDGSNIVDEYTWFYGEAVHTEWKSGWNS